MRRGVPVWTTLLLVALGCAAIAQAQEKPGEKDFRSYCAACHRYDGQNMGEAPPLRDSPWVDGPAERLIKIILHGVRGRIELHGEVYDREMPGFGPVLSDKRVAELVSLVRATIGKGGKPVAASQVKAIRAKHSARTEYWHADELLDGQ